MPASKVQMQGSRAEPPTWGGVGCGGERGNVAGGMCGCAAGKQEGHAEEGMGSAPHMHRMLHAQPPRAVGCCHQWSSEY